MQKVKDTDGKNIKIDYIDSLLLITIYKINDWFTVRELSEAISSIAGNKNKESLRAFIRARIKKFNKYGFLISKKVYKVDVYKINKRNVIYGNADLVISNGKVKRKFNFDELLGIRYTDNIWYFIKV